MIEELQQLRKGVDGQEGTADDGLGSLQELGLNDAGFKLDNEFVRITAIGEHASIRYRITCIVLLKKDRSVVVFWDEAPVF